ncbi:hypothetical protein BGW36DRAFT_391998 [Talaromyces proteolyticus]|uniref:Uncharacterized protein n=1 Tax=Talaromyces proteolyticus TaxID=1131652 RepID=A0AAD4PRM9_9EURO|nr:uncharacterized protein BGW36DRAFT_391998 [Talaromyces proteolyticus]KAH8689207.1 hypothetical protein BGW36DRAFT_391998 [Talaromyces proteolyticus]
MYSFCISILIGCYPPCLVEVRWETKYFFPVGVTISALHHGAELWREMRVDSWILPHKIVNHLSHVTNTLIIISYSID